MTDREVYPNAPLRLVTAEFRFPLSPRLGGNDVVELLADELGTGLPIIEPAGIPFDAVGGQLSLPLPAAMNYRLLTRDRTRAVTVGPSRIAVETTSYEHWEDFRDGMITEALAALGDRLGALAGIDRVGLRYVNELRAPVTVPDVDAWREYVAPELLSAASLVKTGAVSSVQVALHIDRGDGAELVARAGLLDGHVVDTSGPLHLRTPPRPGYFFLLDMDSFWTRSGGYDEWDTQATIAIADRLHEPIDEFFESCITEKLRDEVLRRHQ